MRVFIINPLFTFTTILFLYFRSGKVPWVPQILIEPRPNGGEVGLLGLSDSVDRLTEMDEVSQARGEQVIAGAFRPPSFLWVCLFNRLILC